MTALHEAWSDEDGVARVRELFGATFGGAGDDAVAVWSAPGRVNLIGEHTDYNAGLCLPVALPHRTFVALRRRDDTLVRIASAQERVDGTPQLRELDLADVTPGSVEGWPACVVGVAWALREAGHDVPGFDAVVDSCVPYGAGLSSSAAIESAFAVALDEISGTGLAASDAGRVELVAACIRAENEMAGAPTGGMDQGASLRCSPGTALLLDCRPELAADETATHVPFDLDAAGLALLVIDTRAEHQLADGQYAQRRSTCEDAARTLGVAHLRELADSLDAQGDAGDGLAAALERLPDDVSRARVRHVVTEIGRVREFVALVSDGRTAEVGPLMDASHASLRDDYEVSCAELDVAVEAARAAGALGARMTGGGFGGSAIALVRADVVDAVGDAVVAAFADAGFTAPDLLVATASASADRSA
ncbi:galactokinase [Cellulomonas sp. PhB143]|uniref:galactokinase n=1 Tax=Cellulomonas sp. PhB143 TaxID=2485186 RepID=UPI000F49FB1D|nr:galactokinase [Cellulomonas sp. PhB143]ROS76843.1 galactokinase [Cellulomonas sp. PhB143]